MIQWPRFRGNEKKNKTMSRSYEGLSAAVEQGKNRVLLGDVNLWGTTADPVDGGRDWQTQLKENELSDLNIPTENIFDPKKRDGTYTEEDTRNEAKHLREGAFHYMKVTNESGGVLSALESGVVAIRAVLGSRAYFDISSLEAEGKITETVVRARDIVKEKLTRMNERFDIPNITTSEEMTEREWFSSIAQDVKKEVTPEPVSVDDIARANRSPLKARVHLSGTGVPATNTNAKGIVKNFLLEQGIEVTDAFKVDFEDGSRSRGSDVRKESDERETSAVSLHIITNDRLSIGGTAETFWLALSALTNGQKFGIYLEDPDEKELRFAARFAQGEGAVSHDLSETPDEQATRETKEAFKVRRSLKIHLQALQEDFPGLLYVASSPQELAQWAKGQMTV